MPLPNFLPEDEVTTGPPTYAREINTPRSLDDTAYVTDEQINQSGQAEGSSIPPLQHGQYRVQPPTGFRVIRSSVSFGGQVVVLGWIDVTDSADGLGQCKVAGYRIYASGVFSNFQPTLVGNASVSPCVCRVTSDVASVVTFTIQPYLSSGLTLPIQACPTCTATTPNPVAASGATVAPVGSTDTAPTTTTPVCSYTPVAGNTIVVLYATTNTISGGLTDNQGTSYATDISFNTAGIDIGVYRNTSALTGAPLVITPTITPNGDFRNTFIVAEFTSLQPPSAGVLDQAADDTGTSTTPDSSNIITTNASDLLLGFFIRDTTGVISPGSGWSLISNGGNAGTTGAISCMMEAKIVTATGTYSADASTVASSAWGAAITSLKAL